LGGFSSDPKHPFTGTGGLLVSLHGSKFGPPYAYNTDRSAGTFEFDKGRFVDIDGDGYPVYPPPKKTSPYVYFDSRTYGGIGLPTQPPTNGYYGSAANGWAKPHLSSRLSSSSRYWPYNPNDLPPRSPGYEWVNRTTFQIISAGLDDNYGAGYFLIAPTSLPIPGLDPDVRQYPVYPLGLNYADSDLVFGDDDNITNFSEGSRLKDMKP
jgi:hypothetical protein